MQIGGHLCGGGGSARRKLRTPSSSSSEKNREVPPQTSRLVNRTIPGIKPRHLGVVAAVWIKKSALGGRFLESLPVVAPARKVGLVAQQKL